LILWIGPSWEMTMFHWEGFIIPEVQVYALVTHNQARVGHNEAWRIVSVWDIDLVKASRPALLAAERMVKFSRR
jgi:hypothetical protein